MTDRPEPHRFVTTHPTRVEDLNLAVHLDNLAILRAVDEARTALLGMASPLGGSVTEGVVGLPPPLMAFVAGHQVEYLRELAHRPDEPLHLALWVCRVGTSSFDLAAEVRQSASEPVACVVRSSLVVVDATTGRPAQLPQDVRGALAAYLGEPPAFRGAG